MKFRKKQVFEIIDFDELVACGEKHKDDSVMPLSFEIKGFTVIQDRKDLYLVGVTHGDHKMTCDKYLLIDGKECFIKYKNVVNENYEEANSDLESLFDKECLLPNGMKAKIKGCYRTQKDAPMQLMIEYWNNEGLQSTSINFDEVKL